MNFNTDYMKLVQLLDSDLLSRMDASKQTQPLALDLDRSIQIKSLLETMIDDKTTGNKSLMRLMVQLVPLIKGIKGALLNRILGFQSNEVKVTENEIDRLNCLALLSRESEVVCELSVLLLMVDKFIQENSHFEVVDQGGRA